MSMIRHALFPAAAALATLQSAGAQEITPLGGAPLTYELFEATVEHADLADCPAGLASAGAGTFCRLTLAGDRMHVFVFALDGAQPLIAVASYDVGEGGLTF